MQDNDLRILRAAAIPTALVGLIAVVVAAFLAGLQGALGAAIGVVIVAAFFTISLVAVAYAARISPTIMMAAAMGSYFAKIALLAVLLSYFGDSAAWSPEAFTFTVIACTICWTIGEARGFMRTRMLYVDPDVKVPGLVQEKKK